MLKNYFILVLFLSLFSCVSVEFTEPQPFWTEDLNTFPQQLQGTYYSNENDTFKVGKNYYQILSSNDESVMDHQLPDKVFLSDTMLLKKMGKTYFLNAKQEENWSLSLINIKSDNSISIEYILGSYEELNNQLQFIKNQVIKKDENGKIRKFILTPTKKEFKQLLKKNLFEESMILKPINTKQ